MCTWVEIWLLTYLTVILIARGKPIELQRIYDYVEKEDILSFLSVVVAAVALL